MAVTVTYSDASALADIIDCLLEQADAVAGDRATLAARYTRLANELGDAVDALPRPSAFAADVERDMAEHRARRRAAVRGIGACEDALNGRRRAQPIVPGVAPGAPTGTRS